MTDETPTPLTADLSEIIAGITFPKTKVPIFFDEDAQYKVSLLDRAIASLPLFPGEDERKAVEDQRKELTQKREEIAEALKAKKYTAHLTGVPRRLKEDLLASVQERFPTVYETNFIGVKTPVDNPEGDTVYAKERLALHIEKLEFPDGRVNTDAPAISEFLFEKAPDASVIALQNAIAEFETGAKSGYEAAVQDLDF